MKNIFFLFVILTIVTSYSVVASLIDDDLCDEQIFAITEAAEAKEFWVFQRKISSSVQGSILGYFLQFSILGVKLMLAYLLVAN